MKLLFACLMCAYLMFDPAGCLSRAKEAMRLWADCVAPSVFPFLVLLPFFSSDGAKRVYDKLFGRFFRRVFALGPHAAAAVVTGLIAGSPAGALSVAQAYRSGAIDSREAVIALTLASGISPVFLVCGVGQGMFLNAFTGVKILMCSLLSGAVCAFLMARIRIPRQKTKNAQALSAMRETNGVQSGVFAALGICGWMVLFSVYSGMLPDEIGAWFEVSKGCRIAARAGNELLACSIACFSGACVLMQNAVQLMRDGGEAALFFLAKCVQCALGTAFYRLAGMIWQAALSFEKDAFTFSAAGALTLVGVILIFTTVEKDKNNYGTEKTGN